VLSTAETARPTKVGDPIVTVGVAPCCVHVVPSGERSPVRTLPTRVSRTQ